MIVKVTVPDLRTAFSQLIALPSISSASANWDQSNEPVIMLLEGWLKSLGFVTEVMAIPERPGKYNLIATLGTGPGGLVLSGHTDTVPYDDKRWQSDPFTLTERDGRLYGLGTCDMKGFFGLVLESVRELRADDLKRPLIVLATADEESSMSGAQALVDAGRPEGRYAIIGEPTQLRPVRMHKGIMMERLALRGQSGHSSDPALGRNAMEGMHAVLTELLALRSEWQQHYRHPGFDVEFPTLNLGHIHGGDSPNRICAGCELHFDLRPLPGMKIDELRDSIHRRVAPLVRTRELGMTFEPLFDGVPPFETPANAQLVRLCEQLTGHAAQSVAFATEAPFLQQLGLETLVLGPGSIDQAHQPDEFLALDQLQPTMDILTQLIKRCCVDEELPPSPSAGDAEQ